MSRKSFQRSQLFVDRKVQGALLWRVALYWCYAMLTIVASLVSWRILVHGVAHPFNNHIADILDEMSPMILGSAFMLPILLYDMARQTNRFAGPLFRLRNEMRRLSRGEKVLPVHFRDNDFWHEMAEEFNAVVARVEQLEAQQCDVEEVVTVAGAEK
ncbi:MAG: hypothetical protein KF708_10730 [Pirellulales bacterium]|nr:hypothetical protein [Pirellulales bacterium]